MGELPSDHRFSIALPEKYTALKNLLLLNRWEEADRETNAMLLDLAGCTDEGWLWHEDFLNLPRPDLRMINQLWLNHSQGRFGLSVQQRMWQKGSKLKDYEAECHLGDRVGWRRADGTWLTRGEITFDFSAPRGHLPLAFAWWVEGAGIIMGGIGKFWQPDALPNPCQTPAEKVNLRIT